MKYKRFTLDKFQEDAIHSIEKHRSVVVSAATGTGKTLIADYVIDKFLKKGRKIIYTAPIKALSNQKYRDFKKEYGDRVGLLTGDVVINDRAPILIMTTEIYRNMLLEYSDIIKDLSYVIFDEIHYMTDVERGTVWEESIIFSPRYVRFLCLSATIPNAQTFAKWIETIKQHKVDVINYTKRAVPLKHFAYDFEYGQIDFKELGFRIDAEKHFYGKKRRKRKQERLPTPDHCDLIKELYHKDRLPCIFFSFSRKACHDRALEAARKFDFANKKEKAEIIAIYNKLITPTLRKMKTSQQVRQVIAKGVGIHHAGLMPIIKEIVEKLFNKGLIKVLYATETFAVGINMPARSVCFATLEKYDGRNFRYLFSKEYFQMAGRAGRRGIDKIGYVYTLFDRNHDNIDKIKQLTSKDIEPIVSQFKITYNTVLNLVNNYDKNQISRILKSNFGYYVKKQSEKQVRILSSFNYKVRQLTKLGYIDDAGFLTLKGKFASRIYSNELVITELLFEKVFQQLKPAQINVLIAAIVYEPRRGDRFSKTKNIQFNLPIENHVIKKNVNYLYLKKLYKLVYGWCTGTEFSKILDYSNLAEGDIIRLFRRIIDQLRQIRTALYFDSELKRKFKKCIDLIDRDVVRVEF